MAMPLVTRREGVGTLAALYNPGSNSFDELCPGLWTVSPRQSARGWLPLLAPFAVDRHCPRRRCTAECGEFVPVAGFHGRPGELLPFGRSVHVKVMRRQRCCRDDL